SVVRAGARDDGARSEGARVRRGGVAGVGGAIGAAGGSAADAASGSGGGDRDRDARADEGGVGRARVARARARGRRETADGGGVVRALCRDDAREASTGSDREGAGEGGRGADVRGDSARSARSDG